MEAIDDKMNTIIEENKYLKSKISELETKIKSLETVKRKNNLVFFGVEEEGKTETELVDHIKETVEGTGVQMNIQEISNLYRIGRKTENRNQPVVVSLTTIWKKHLTLKNKSNLPPNIYIKEEEKKKGNITYLKQDQLIVIKLKDNNREKRKRETSSSPNQSTQNKASINNFSKNATQPLTKALRNEIIKPNILNYVEKTRSDSQLNNAKN